MDYPHLSKRDTIGDRPPHAPTPKAPLRPGAAPAPRSPVGGADDLSAPEQARHDWRPTAARAAPRGAAGARAGAAVDAVHSHARGFPPAPRSRARAPAQQLA